jgi:hypothetical protein
MKKIIHRSLAIACIIAAFAGCKKNDLVTPGPAPQKKFHFAIQNLPGIITPRQDLTAVYTIVKNNQETVIADKVSILSYDGKYNTLEAKLPAGGYQLSSFLVFDNNAKILFASPRQGSVKAVEVENPLTLSFALNTDAHLTVLVQVARVLETDKSEDFGYAPGSFGTRADYSGMAKIRIHPVVNIGGIVYDSVPVSLSITTWDLQNQPATIQTQLTGGVNEVFVKKSAIKYKLRTSRWGIVDEMEIERTSLSESVIYTLGGSRDAKKLSVVSHSKLLNGFYVTDSKDEYVYNGNGRLWKVLNFKKDNINNIFLNSIDELMYDQFYRVSNVKRTSANGDVQLEDNFQYTQDGKIIKITRQEANNITNATVQYIPMPGRFGLSNNYNIFVKHIMSLQYYEKYHNMAFEGGNMVSDAIVTSHGNSEIGSYQYDFNINPFIYLHYPDLFFTHSSKHNQLLAQKDYHLSIPQTVSYDRQYSYDAEGYPIQLIQKYKSATTGQFLYQAKTLFYY